MEHTDAGAHVGLADACPPEHIYVGNGGAAPALTRPRSPDVILMPPARDGAPDVPGGDRDRGAAADIEDEGDAAAVVVTGRDADGVDDDDDVTDDALDPDGAVAADEPATTLAEVVGLRFVDLLSEPMEWQERALCAQTDPEAFFPEKGGSTREAKRICSGCEVRPECLEYALANDERFGIWGGMSERERRKQRRRAV